MNAGNVCVIGNNTADLVFNHSKKLQPGEKQNADAFDIFPGGQGANTAFTLSTLGIPTSYVGYFGDDIYAQISKESLENEGIDTRDSLTVRCCPNHIASIFVDTERHLRTIMMYKNPKLIKDPIHLARAKIQNYSAIYNDGHEIKISIDASKMANEMKIPVFTDAEVCSDEILELIQYTNTLIAPLCILQEITGESVKTRALEKICELGPSTVLSTMGSDGSACYSKNIGHMLAPAESCIPVDTTGAGDAFHAGFVAAQLRGKDIATSIKIASKIAALKCECSGPRLSGRHYTNLKKGNFSEITL